MKYKRQLMASMFALAMLTGNAGALSVEDFIPNSKTSEYQSQVQMKSFTQDDFSEANNNSFNKEGKKKNQRIY